MADDGSWHDWGFPDPVGSQLFLGKLLHAVVRKGSPWDGLINGEKVLVHGSLEGAKQAVDWHIAQRLESATFSIRKFRERIPRQQNTHIQCGAEHVAEIEIGTE